MHAAARAWSGQVSGNQAVVKVGRRCPFSEPSCSFTRLFGFDCCAVRRMETAEKLAKLKEIKPGPWSIPGDHQWKSIHYVWSMKFRVRIKWKYTVMIINLFRVLVLRLKEIKPGPWSIQGDHQMNIHRRWIPVPWALRRINMLELPSDFVCIKRLNLVGSRLTTVRF